MDIAIPYNWKPRDYQMPLWAFMEGGGKRAVAVWHRRGGKDLFSLNWCATAMAERPGVYWHLFPTYNQGRKIAWDGFTKDGRKFIDHFPEPLIEAKNNTEMKLTLKTGGVYQVIGTDDPDRLVGANPVGCIFSEYSLQDPRAWNYIRPILAENGGWAIFIYTARGNNHGKRMLDMAKKNPNWFAQVLTVDDTRAIPLAAVQEERDSGMPEEMIQQEFYCSFEAPIVGAYYGSQMMKMSEESRICNVPYEPALPVHTAWDLGVGDATSITFYQVYGLEVRIIDYCEASGEGLPYYAKILKEKDYVYGMHFAPWDIEVREFSSGKSRKETAASLGIKFQVVKQHSIEDGIENVRNFLPRCWVDSKKAERLVDCLRNYRKEYDEVRKVYKNVPVHDWASHGADCFRYLAWGFREKKKTGNKAPQEKADGDYDVHAQ